MNRFLVLSIALGVGVSDAAAQAGTCPDTWKTIFYADTVRGQGANAEGGAERTSYACWAGNAR